jgi:hypothetical protein
MTHYLTHQLYNFNILAFVLICLFVVLLGKANMKKEIKKVHEDIENEVHKNLDEWHQEVMNELSEMERDLKYILGRMEK